MKRLFLKVYLGIAAVLIVGTAATLFLLERRVDAVRREVQETRLVETLLAIRHRAQEDPFFVPDSFRQLGRMFRLRVEVVSLTSLREAIRSRVTDGETFVVQSERGPVVYTAYGDEQALVGSAGRDTERRRPPWQGERGRGFFGRPPESRPGEPPPLERDRMPFFAAGPYFLLLLLAVPLLLVAPAIFLMIRPVERRVRELSEAAERFGEGRLESRARLPANDALAGLATTFNQMADRIQSLVTGQKELLRAVSHELRTPLARMFFVLDDAEAAQSEEERRRHLERIQSGLAEMNDLVEELLSFVRLDAGNLDDLSETVDVRAVLDEAAGVGRELRDDMRIENLSGDVRLRGVPRYVKRAVVNLVTNAARHATSRVELNARHTTDGVEITVDDDGAGVPPSSRAQVFEPFTRVDSSRNAAIGGAGLGLAIVSRIAALHGGTADVVDSSLGGARFRIVFPERRVEPPKD